MTALSTLRPEIPLRVITAADVRASIGRAQRGLDKAADEIVWQIEMEAWRTLGYSSWGAMRDAEYGGIAFMVPPKNRPELVGRMRAKGLTQKEIADTAGVTERTVRSDLASTGNVSGSPITNSRGQQRPATYARPERHDDDVIDAEIVEDEPAPAPVARPQIAPAPQINTSAAVDQTVQNTPHKETDPAPAESVTTTTCPTCHGTGEVTR